VFLAGTVLAIAWESMSQPAVFSLIGETLARGRRAMGSSVQSILKRIPRIVAPLLGGLLMVMHGLREGLG